MRKKAARQLLAACLIAGTGIAPLSTMAASETLVPHTATYKIRISIASGTLTTSVRESTDGFAVNSVIEPTGLAAILTSGTIEESSQFAVDENGVRPHVYASDDTLSRENMFMDFRFDWENHLVSGTVNDEFFEFDLDQEVHDRVSIQYELMHNLMSDSPSTEYAMLDGDELKQITVSNIGTESVKVPLGRFEAVGVQHQAAGSKRITTLWCAPELGYLPVLIEQSRKGKVRVRAQLIDYAPAEKLDGAP